MIKLGLCAVLLLALGVPALGGDGMLNVKDASLGYMHMPSRDMDDFTTASVTLKATPILPPRDFSDDPLDWLLGNLGLDLIGTNDSSAPQSFMVGLSLPLMSIGAEPVMVRVGAAYVQGKPGVHIRGAIWEF